MATIDLTEMRFLGCDYERLRDYYLNEETGKIYVREVVLVKDNKDIRMADAKIFELVKGELKFNSGKQPLTATN